MHHTYSLFNEKLSNLLYKNIFISIEINVVSNRDVEESTKRKLEVVEGKYLEKVDLKIFF